MIQYNQHSVDSMRNMLTKLVCKTKQNKNFYAIQTAESVTCSVVFKISTETPFAALKETLGMV